MERLKVGGSFFVARPQATVVPHPRQASFHHVAGFPQAAAVRAAAKSDQGCHQQTHDPCDQRRESVATIALKVLGPSWLAVTPHDLRQPFDRGRCRLVIAFIGRSGMHRQREAVGIHNYMTLATEFASVGRVGSGMAPPKSARTEALSMTARNQLIRWASSKRCSSSEERRV